MRLVTTFRTAPSHSWRWRWPLRVALPEVAGPRRRAADAEEFLLLLERKAQEGRLRPVRPARREERESF